MSETSRPLRSRGCPILIEPSPMCPGHDRGTGAPNLECDSDKPESRDPSRDLGPQVCLNFSEHMGISKIPGNPRKHWAGPRSGFAEHTGIPNTWGPMPLQGSTLTEPKEGRASRIRLCSIFAEHIGIPRDP